MSASVADLFAAAPDDCYSVGIALALARICNALYLPSSQWQHDDTVKSLKSPLIIEETGDTHCLIGDVQGTNITILAFRGTGPISPPNWLTDFEARLQPKDGTVQTHEGFAKAYQSLESRILNRLQKDRSLWVTGHSLGGALATLAAAKLPAQGFRVQSTYTYGAPRVGNAAFADSLPLPFYRFVYGRDIVPHLPPQGVYQHGGVKVSATEEGTLDRAAEAGDGGDADAPETAGLRELAATVAGSSAISALGGLLDAAANVVNPQHELERLLNNPLVAEVVRKASQGQETVIADELAKQAAALFPPPVRDHFPVQYVNALERAQKNSE